MADEEQPKTAEWLVQVAGAGTEYEARVRSEIGENDTVLVDRGLMALGHYRSQLQPEIPTSWDDHQTFGISLTHWHVDANLMSGLPIIHVRSPGFGWMHMQLTKDEAKKMILWLTKFAEAPDEQPPVVKN